MEDVSAYVSMCVECKIGSVGRQWSKRKGEDNIQMNEWNEEKEEEKKEKKRDGMAIGQMDAG